MRSWIVMLITPVLLIAQHSPPPASPGWPPPATNPLDPYRAPNVAPVRFENTSRWDALYRDGKIFLSLRDAIALGLENNLDLELVRYAPRIAETDEQRAAAGGVLRGIPLSVREGPQGLGIPTVGPNGTLAGGDTPALNSLVGPGVQTDLSILGSLPLSTGPAVPGLDPVLVGNLDFGHSSNPQNNALLPDLRSLNARFVQSGVDIQQGFITGGYLDLGWNNLNQRINDPLLNYNPYNTASLGLTFTQPLLRGFGHEVNNRYIRIAHNNGQIADYVFQQQVIATVTTVVRLYWDLATLNQDVQVRREAVASAEQLLKDTQNQAEAGTAAPLDITRARAELARRRRDQSVAETLVRQQEIVLKDYISRAKLDNNIGNAPIVITDTLKIPDVEPVEPINDMMERAYENRPDLAQARLQLVNSEISLKGSRSALLPALDFVASGQNNGLAGDPAGVAVVPGTSSLLPGPHIGDPLLTGGFGSAASQLFTRNFPDYTVGLRLSIPLRNRAARADVVRDQLTVRQQQVRLQQLNKQVRLEVTNAMIALEQARASWEATREERILGEQTLDAEREKVEVGASTTFYVIQYQRDLAAARSAEISALASYVKARTALQRALGTTLSDYGVVLDEARQGVVQRRSNP